jgi:cyclophilin family peptidyl-prolyl cis-trans isomerase
MNRVVIGVCLLVGCVLSLPGVAAAQSPAASDPSQLEALIQTTKGDITIRFFPNEAPKHVAHFIETARSGGFDKTTFHRVIPYAIIQGGDPISKDPKKKALYGSGGVKLLPDELNSIPHYPGAVSAVALPDAQGNPIPGSTGTQFFICDTWQTGLDGKYSVFARVTSGMDVVRAISVLPANVDKVTGRVEITKVTVRPLSPSVEELKRLRAKVVTTHGEVVFEFLADTAPENARHFVNVARSGYYDGANIYRLVKDYVVQGADASTWPADSPNRMRSFSIWPVRAELTPTLPFDRGIVGLAHGPDPNDGTVHFFFLLRRTEQLDNKFTAFGRVVSGMEVLEKINQLPVTGEKLDGPLPILKLSIE